MEQLFKKENLDDISYEHFEMAAYAAMTAGYSEIALIGIPTGEEIILHGSQGEFEGRFRRTSLVSLRNYCDSLELLVTDKKGKFLIYSKIDGLSSKEVIEEAYREFLSVKHLILTEAVPAFPKGNMDSSLIKEWNEQWADVDKKLRDYYQREGNV